MAIDPAPIKGILYIPPSALRVASIALRNPANRNRPVSLTRKQFRYGFGNAPLLVTGGGKDHTVPAAVSKSTVKHYRKSPAVTEYKEFPDRGHTLALDRGWGARLPTPC